MSTNYLIIDLQSTAYFQQQTNLENQTRILIFKYNSRESAFYMDILDAQSSPIVLAVKLVPFWPILGHIDLSSYGIHGFFYLCPKAGTTAPPVTQSSDLAQYYFLNYVTLNN